MLVQRQQTRFGDLHAIWNRAKANLSNYVKQLP
jgi:hypothetical protein